MALIKPPLPSIKSPELAIEPERKLTIETETRKMNSRNDSMIKSKEKAIGKPITSVLEEFLVV